VTLYECLRAITLLLAPLCPFVSDELWTNLGGTGESVHLADWPEVDATAIDPALEHDVDAARKIVTLGRAARTEARIRVRQPLPRALVLLPGAAELPAALLDEVADELNVKRVEQIVDLTGLLDHRVVPNFRRLGPRLGPLMPKVKEVLETLDGAAVSEAIERDGELRVEIDGTTVKLSVDDLEVRAVAHEELALVEEAGYAVALDTTVDEALRLEGVARELVRAVNDLRKALDLQLSDRIRVTVEADGRVAEAARRHEEWIAREVLATSWDVRSGARADDGSHALEIDGEAVAVAIEVVGEGAESG
jgi:isoleucyl-tRNA synthetase